MLMTTAGAHLSNVPAVAIVLTAGALVVLAPGAASQPVFPYVDALIEGEPASDDAGTAADARRREPEGRRSTVIESRAYASRQDGRGESYETGLYALYRFETRNHGEMSIEAGGQWRDEGSAFLGDRGGSGYFAIRQRDMPFAGGWRMSNGLGTLRTINPGVFQSPYRFTLPTTLVRGAATYWRRAASGGPSGGLQVPASALTAQLELGEIVRLTGFQGLGQTGTGGHAMVASVSASPEPAWSGGLQLARVSGVEGLLDADAATIALAWEPPGGPWRGRVQMLRDSGRRGGEWLEGGWSRDWHELRASLWRFDPGLSWLDSLLSSGQRGASLRYDYTDPALYAGLGLEFQRSAGLTGVREGYDTVLASGRLGRRLDRRRSIGLQWQTRDLLGGQGTVPAQRYRSITLSGLRSQRAVRDRLAYTWVGSAADTEVQLHELAWTRDLVLDGERTLGFTLGMVVEQADGEPDRLRPTAGLNWAGRAFEAARYDLWLRYARDASRFSTATTMSASAQIAWPVATNWWLQLQAAINTVAFDAREPVFDGAPDTLRGESVWLLLRYAKDAGQGFAGGLGGAGALEGLVFFDENGDGVRQADEGPAAGVIVLLDRGEAARSGPDGRYRFDGVPAGAHRVRVDLSTVRLPWGLGNAPFGRVEIGPRGGARYDIGLVRIGE